MEKPTRVTIPPSRAPSDVTGAPSPTTGAFARQAKRTALLAIKRTTASIAAKASDSGEVYNTEELVSVATALAAMIVNKEIAEQSQDAATETTTSASTSSGPVGRTKRERRRILAEAREGIKVQLEAWKAFHKMVTQKLLATNYRDEDKTGNLE